MASFESINALYLRTYNLLWGLTGGYSEDNIWRASMVSALAHLQAAWQLHYMMLNTVVK